MAESSFPERTWAVFPGKAALFAKKVRFLVIRYLVSLVSLGKLGVAWKALDTNLRLESQRFTLLLSTLNVI